MPMFSVGSNSHGQLGHGGTDDSATFLPVSLAADLRPREIVFGGMHTLALCLGATGPRLLVAGSNTRGQLGPGAVVPREAFEELSLDELLEGLSSEARRGMEGTAYEICEVAAAWETSFMHLRAVDARRSDVLLSMGANDWDELAVGPVEGSQESPTVHRVPLSHLLPINSTRKATEQPFVRVRSIKAGPRHVVAQIEVHSHESGVWAVKPLIVGWGAARHGELGSPFHSAASSRLPRTISIPTIVPFLSLALLGPESIIDFALGRDHTAFLVESNGTSRIVTMGSNKQGQLGSTATGSYGVINPASLEDPGGHSNFQRALAGVACTWSGTYVLSRDGLTPTSPLPLHLSACGSNAHGQLARPPSSLPSSSTPLPISLPAECISRPVPTIVKLACGSEHVLLLALAGAGSNDESNEVWAWGWNEHGNLATGGTDNVDLPVRIWSPAQSAGGRVTDVWAGNATSWVWVDPPRDEVDEA